MYLILYIKNIFLTFHQCCVFLNKNRTDGLKMLDRMYVVVLWVVVLAVFGVPLFLVLSLEYEEWEIVYECKEDGHSEQYCEKYLEELLPS